MCTACLKFCDQLKGMPSFGGFNNPEFKLNYFIGKLIYINVCAKKYDIAEP